MAAVLAIGLSPFTLTHVYYSYIAEGPAAPYVRWNAMPFDQDRWFMDWKHSRHYMVDDLLSRHQLVGWTRNEVEALIGRTEMSDSGFEVYLGEDYPGSERSSKTFYLTFAQGKGGVVDRVGFTCRGAC